MWEIRPFQSLRLWWNRLISMAVICCQARAIPLTVDEPVSSESEEMETGFYHFCTVSLLTIFLSKLQTHDLFFYMHPFTWKHHWTLLILLDFVTVGYTTKVWKCSTKRMGWEGLMRGTGEKKKNVAEARREWLNSLILSPKLEKLPRRSEGKLSMDPESESVSEMDRGPSPSSVASWVSCRNTYTGRENEDENISTASPQVG